jgi:hypothetical protein
MLAVGRSPRPDILEAIRHNLVSDGHSVRVSRHVKDLFPTPGLVLLLDGWVKMQLAEAWDVLREFLPWTPRLAILTPGRHVPPPTLLGGRVIMWPFALDELRAAVRTALSSAPSIGTADITVDPDRLEVQCNSVHMSLTRAEFRLMVHLLKAPDQWSSSKLLRESTAGERRLGMTPIAEHIHALRKKLRHEAWRLHSHRSLGYFFDPSQSAQSSAPLTKKR